MGLLATDAIVLHAFDYLETSRILRLATRDAGVQSVLARGARNSRKRFGSALDLFAEGRVELQLKPGRDLHTLVSFDAGVGRHALATDLSRFAAAAALAECALRVVHEEAAPQAYEVIARGLDLINDATADQSVSAALGALWRLMAEIGYAPALDNCASCHAVIPATGDISFSHVAGGMLCDKCASAGLGGRRLPDDAHNALRNWLTGHNATLETDGAKRAHQRLFREFAAQHMPDARPLLAYAAWEQDTLGQ